MRTGPVTTALLATDTTRKLWQVSPLAAMPA